MKKHRIIQGNALEVLKTIPDGVIQTCVTSPPYWGLRDYGIEGQLGAENTPEEYVQKIIEVFAQVRRVLKDDGTLWVNLGDSYAGGGQGGHRDKKAAKGVQMRSLNIAPGLKPKDLVGVPWMVAFALRSDGWFLRSDIIWNKPNAMPASVTDRPTTAHEYIFLLSKSARYHYDIDAIREPYKDTGESKFRKNPLGRNKRTVWDVATNPFKGAHFATFPEALVEPCILAGSRPGDVVMDVFNGAATTGVVALKHGRKYLGIELNPDYIELSENRIQAMLKAGRA
jgi:DNA modification methylase